VSKRVSMDVTRTDYSDERAARDATNRRRTTRLGYVGGAVIQPNAQVCRRLAGASQECSPPHIPPADSRSGWAPPRCSLPRPHPSPADRSSPNPLRVSQWYTATSSTTTTTTTIITTIATTTTTIANYGTQAQVPAHGRNGPR